MTSNHASYGLKLPYTRVSEAGSYYTHQKHNLHEDDETSCLPPPLSAYSLAVLQDKATSPTPDRGVKLSPAHQTAITGIYELDFPSRSRVKLSVHFTETSVHHRSSANNTQLSFNCAPNTPFTEISANNTHNTDKPLLVLPTQDELSEFSTQNHSQRTYYTPNPPTVLQTLMRGRNRRMTRIGLGPPKRALRTSDTTNEDLKEAKKEPSYYEYLDLRLESAQKNSFDDLSEQALSRELDKAQQSRLEKLRHEKLDLERSKLEFRKKQLMEQKTEAELAERMHRDSLLDAKLREEASAEIQIKQEYAESKLQLEKQYARLKELESAGARRPEKLRDVSREVDEFIKKPRVGEELARLGVRADAAKKHIEYVPRQALSEVPPNQLSSKPCIDYKHKAMLEAPLIQVLADPPASRDRPKKQMFQINDTQFEKLELIGRGGSSKVYKAKSMRNNRIYAIKKVLFDQFDDASVHGFKGEIDLLLHLRETTDRVVRLIDYSMTDGSLYLVMECGEIDLAHVLSDRIKRPLDINFVRYHTIELFKCVESVHQAGIVHSDLKPANFLFVRGTLKLIDFGISNAVPEHTVNIYRESQIGTPNYMAPEALVESKGFNMYEDEENDAPNTWKVGKPSDIWSCGCILYQMVYGRPPYGSYSGHQRLMAIMNPQVQIQYPDRGLGEVLVPQSAIAAMKQCLARDPNERLSASEVLVGLFLKPRVVSEEFIKDLVHSAVDYGHNNLVGDEVYNRLVETVMHKILELNY
ncbi:hypothetical protein BABINDRAFT_160308 [Babjeviella inositovora NRRL Y-12698]|uniref:Protein kinase domain-containing protein n=1 Tax=Babjeviella inositovora NRRL Y-12698 TaxID=984486 RepID=A0A1E3QWQ8_9ASCO|nr:uncharacterized protein BABINDRAFT_160308 [Babjeviella inositovora NRRL Y-12698]ODQ82129.1 hypothetical protein BABINDRAFT_160308 [Babjeviella inositovora NRRL Y-12698]